MKIHNEYICPVFDQADYDWYTKHFDYVETLEEAREKFGAPERIETDYGWWDGAARICYQTYYYEGFAFGSLGSGGDIGCLRVYEAGIMPIRDGIDIGASRAEVEQAYWAKEKSEHGDYVYFLKHKDDCCGGIYIHITYDENDKVVEISVTDGL